MRKLFCYSHRSSAKVCIDMSQRLNHESKILKGNYKQADPSNPHLPLAFVLLPRRLFLNLELMEVMPPLQCRRIDEESFKMTSSRRMGAFHNTM